MLAEHFAPASETATIVWHLRTISHHPQTTQELYAFDVSRSTASTKRRQRQRWCTTKLVDAWSPINTTNMRKVCVCVCVCAGSLSRCLNDNKQSIARSSIMCRLLSNRFEIARGAFPLPPSVHLLFVGAIDWTPAALYHQAKGIAFVSTIWITILHWQYNTILESCAPIVTIWTVFWIRFRFDAVIAFQRNTCSVWFSHTPYTAIAIECWL